MSTPGGGRGKPTRRRRGPAGGCPRARLRSPPLPCPRRPLRSGCRGHPPYRRARNPSPHNKSGRRAAAAAGWGRGGGGGMKKRRRQQAGRQESARQAGAGGRQAGRDLAAGARIRTDSHRAALCPGREEPLRRARGGRGGGSSAPHPPHPPRFSPVLSPGRRSAAEASRRRTRLSSSSLRRRASLPGGKAGGAFFPRPRPGRGRPPLASAAPAAPQDSALWRCSCCRWRRAAAAPQGKHRELLPRRPHRPARTTAQPARWVGMCARVWRASEPATERERERDSPRGTCKREL